MRELSLRYKAVESRRAGKTYTEICDTLGFIPKGTLSQWLKDIELSEGQKERIKEKITNGGALGRQKGGLKNHEKRLVRIALIQDEAEKDFTSFSQDPFFMLGLALYLAEGGKKSERFQFTNSDPNLVRPMIKWIERFYGIDRGAIKARLYAHETYRSEDCERYWSELLALPLGQFQRTVYKSTPHTLKKNPDYKGCIRIEVDGSVLYWKIMKWRAMLYASPTFA